MVESPANPDGGGIGQQRGYDAVESPEVIHGGGDGQAPDRSPDGGFGQAGVAFEPLEDGSLGRAEGQQHHGHRQRDESPRVVVVAECETAQRRRQCQGEQRPGQAERPSPPPDHGHQPRERLTGSHRQFAYHPGPCSGLGNRADGIHH